MILEPRHREGIGGSGNWRSRREHSLTLTATVSGRQQVPGVTTVPDSGGIPSKLKSFSPWIAINSAANLIFISALVLAYVSRAECAASIAEIFPRMGSDDEPTRPNRPADRSGHGDKRSFLEYVLHTTLDGTGVELRGPTPGKPAGGCDARLWPPESCPSASFPPTSFPSPSVVRSTCAIWRERTSAATAFRRPGGHGATSRSDPSAYRTACGTTS